MKLSVLVPQAMHDSRQSVEFLSSWTDQVGVDPLDYEIIVAVNAQYPAVVDRCQALVREHDRVIAVHGENEMHYYEFAIRAAQGRLLLFTEDHVRADEKCVRGVLDFFENSKAEAAFLRSGHINSNRFAGAEADAYNERLRDVWLQPGCWDRVQLRGCVLTPELLQAAGGFPWQYSLFCTRLLGARIRQLNQTIEYCSGATIHHVNLPRPGLLQHDVTLYVNGECQYSDEQHAPHIDGYIALPDILLRRRDRAEQPAHEAYANLASTLVAQLSRKPSLGTLTTLAHLFEEGLRLAPEALLGPRSDYCKELLRLMRTRVAYDVRKYFERHKVDAFERLWEAYANHARAKHCLTPLPQVKGPRRNPLVNDQLNVRLNGFYQSEDWQGQRFQWSKPLASITLKLVPGSYRVGIDTGGLRGSDYDFSFALFFNGKLIDRERLETDENWISFPVTENMFRVGRPQRISLIVSPLSHRSGETRRLGIPLFAVRCQAEGSQVATKAA